MDRNTKRSLSMTYRAAIPSPLGILHLFSDGTALTGLALRPGQEPEAVQIPAENLAIFNSVKTWLDAYFSGDPRPVDFPLAPAGTDFQRRVWALLLTIPYGKTTTYGALAGHLGTKPSPQAVGQAVGKNPIAIVIPCHRVVGVGGQLTGYAWGLDKKQILLTHEGIVL
jgi:methylated-DNA-[protein]-cysteine S-methyltransferase